MDYAWTERRRGQAVMERHHGAAQSITVSFLTGPPGDHAGHSLVFGGNQLNVIGVVPARSRYCATVSSRSQKHSGWK